jgi:uncharacterized protein (DUF1810 family)
LGEFWGGAQSCNNQRHLVVALAQLRVFSLLKVQPHSLRLQAKRESPRVGEHETDCSRLLFPQLVARYDLLPSALRRAMFSLSASWAFSLHPVLPPDYRPLFCHEDGSGPGVRRSHRNSAFGLCLSFSALVAKEVAFEQAAGDRSTVDLYEC